MSNWPSKRKKSGRAHIAKVGMIGMGDKRGTGKKLSSGKIRAKGKEALRKETEELNNEDKTNTVDYAMNCKNMLNWS